MPGFIPYDIWGGRREDRGRKAKGVDRIKEEEAEGKRGEVENEGVLGKDGIEEDKRGGGEVKDEERKKEEEGEERGG